MGIGDAHVRTVTYRSLHTIKISVNYPDDSSERLPLQNIYDFENTLFAVGHHNLAALAVRQRFTEQSVVSTLDQKESTAMLRSLQPYLVGDDDGPSSDHS